MSRVDLHPEELLDRAQSGVASKEELLRLEAHLTSCKACRFEHALVADSRRSTAPQRGDEITAERIRSAVLRAFEERRLPSSRRSGRRKNWILLACAASLCVTAALAATAVVHEQERFEPQHGEGSRGMGLVRSVGGSARRSIGGMVRAIAAATASQSGTNALEGAPAEADAVRTPRKSPARVPATELFETASSAKELFARANLLRRNNDTGEALRVYRELQQSFPSSPEALVSKVALGRLLLDRLGDAKGALAQFDGYLGSSPRGALGEEALIGRALSLGRLRRTAEEKSTWSALLAAHPKSTYAARARARIEQLSSR